MGDSDITVENVLIAGGGDIGLLTGLCITQFNPDIDIVIVDDFETDPPEVGKSTYADITSILHGLLEIPPLTFYTEVKPIWKGSVYFKDWCGSGPFHYAFDAADKIPDPPVSRLGEYTQYYYDEVCESTDQRTVNEAMVEDGKSPIYFGAGGDLSLYDSYAYHLDLSRFNTFLEDVCEDRGITLCDDRITGVETDGTHIECVASSSRDYEADLYVDATGFNRVLKNKLDDSFRDFELPLDSAFNAKTERSLADVEPGTVIETGEYGWFWQIDTYEFRDRGYVFASEFVSDDDAAAEFVSHVGGISTGDLTKHEFTSGYFSTPLQGNCLTIGNAEGFIEPLQSTALTANTTAAVEFAHLLSAHGGVCDEGVRTAYNAWNERMWESIYDFICTHYKFAPGTNRFWETMHAIPVSDRVEKLVECYDQRGFDAGFGTGTTIDPIENEETMNDLLVFPPIMFYILMSEMGVESEFYEREPFDVSGDVKDQMDELYAGLEADAEELLSVEELYRGFLPQIRKNASERGSVDTTAFSGAGELF